MSQSKDTTMDELESATSGAKSCLKTIAEELERLANYGEQITTLADALRRQLP